MMPVHKKLLIVLIILAALVVGYFLWGKNLIYPPRASENLTIYNIDSRGIDSFDGVTPHAPGRTVRWKTLPVTIYNKAELSYLQDVVNEWNQAMGQEVFKIGGPDSPIVIEADSQISPIGIENYRYKHSLLEKVQIIINPEPNKYEKNDLYHPKDILKDKLGHALGFFGHTTDDPNGVMDIDHTKSNTVISPFVISVLKELYKLPPGTRGKIEKITRQIREDLRKYNIDSRNAQFSFDSLEAIEEFKQQGKLPPSQLPTRLIRWRNLPVAVYDKDHLVPDLQNIIDEWNQAMGQEVFKIGGPDSAIVIEKDANRPMVELVVWTPKKSYLLSKVQIINNPQWINSNKIKHQLGHALGFFGHTTDDPNGIMDPDYDKAKIISPLVTSVLKELYKLPPGIKIIDPFSRTDQEILKLRQAIKKYNLTARGKDLPVRTVRWRSLPVSIYNQANVSGLQSILDEWNQAMGQEVFKIGGPDSPIVIEEDANGNLYPGFDAKTQHYLLTEFKIRVNLKNPNLHFLKHQLGHALGFFGHTTNEEDPNGIMNKDHTKTNTIISPFVVSVLKELYYLPPAVIIGY